MQAPKYSDMIRKNAFIYHLNFKKFVKDNFSQNVLDLPPKRA